MFCKILEYTNYNDEQKANKFYFNLDEVEVIRFEAAYPNGIQAHVEELAEKNDRAGVVALLEDLIIKSYGIKSEDGETFEKSDEIYNHFKNTAAYNQLFVDLLSGDGKKAIEFFNNVVLSAVNRAKAKQQVDEPSGVGQTP